MLNDILGRARRRILSHRLYATLLISGAVFTGGLVLLLILGTGIWNWWIPPLLLAGALGIGITLLVISRPAEDDVAQLLDTRCQLADALATALYFRTSPLPMAAVQRRRAESAAAGIDFAQALPFQLPRTTYVLAGLVLAAAGLFLYRFGAEKQLDLHAPIAALPFFAPGGTSPKEDQARRDRDSHAKAGVTLPANALDRLGTSTSDNPDEKDLGSPPGSAVTSEARAKSQEGGPTADGKKPDGAGSEASDSAQAGANPPQPGAEQPPSSRDGAPQSAQGAAKNSGGPNSSGLMSKLREAVSGLLSKLKPTRDPQSPNGTPGTQQANGKQSSGQQGGQKPGQQDAKGNPSEQEGQESAAESEQMAPGKGAGKSSEQNASAKPGSGMGHQDGSKELKDAEQLNAMGKLSEIIGKRSANITGEMTIEPQSGPQQLKTGYTRSTARHGEAGGDVNRDEVPVEMQAYVEQYFDQVRKQAAAGALRGEAHAAKAARGSKTTEN